jgi:hypothetical protein
MKRRVEKRRMGMVRAYDVRKDLSSETLGALGACALIFNDLQAMLEILVGLVIGANPFSWKELNNRISSIEYKIEICKFAFKNLLTLPDDMYSMVENSFVALSQYKGYRDTAIHSRIIDVNKGIGEMTFRRDKIEEILITEQALNGLYDHMFVLVDELREMVSLVEALETLKVTDAKDPNAYKRLMVRHAARMVAMAEGKPGAIAASGIGFALSQDEQTTAREAQDAFSRFRHYQDQRKSLPPLPAFQPSSNSGEC